MQLQIAMNIFYDLMMQCQYGLPNAHDRNTLLIFRRCLDAKRFHIFLIITTCIYFFVNAMCEI